MLASFNNERYVRIPTVIALTLYYVLCTIQYVNIGIWRTNNMLIYDVHTYICNDIPIMISAICICFEILYKMLLDA